MARCGRMGVERQANMKRPKRRKHWRCFFCDEVFRSRRSAEAHFGPDDGEEKYPAMCVDPLRTDEKARLKELRDAQVMAMDCQDSANRAEDRADDLARELDEFKALTKCQSSHELRMKLDFQEGELITARALTAYRPPEVVPVVPRVPKVVNPVPIVFSPEECCARDDSKDHEGVRFSEVWNDAVARTVWLGVKPFMITSQYFRGSCIRAANHLRKYPDYVLDEFFAISMDNSLGGGWGVELWSQLAPHLIWALENQGCWPYFHLPTEELRWKRVEKKATA